MTTFNFGSYLNVIKDYLINNKGQEKAAIFLLNSITNQIKEDISLDKSKISNLANNKIEVDEKIKKALNQQKIVNSTHDYFNDILIDDIDSERENEIYNKIMNQLDNDDSVSKEKIEQFKSNYDSEKIGDFLAQTFIYAVKRQNKASFEQYKKNDNIPQLPSNIINNEGINTGLQVAHARKIENNINIHMSSFNNTDKMNTQYNTENLDFPHYEYYNLIVGWDINNVEFRHDSKTIGSFLFPKSRILNSWISDDVNALSKLEKLERDILKDLPCIFAKDQGPVGDTQGDLAYIGNIHKIKLIGNMVKVYFELRLSFEQTKLYKYKFEFEIDEYELYNTHWAVKEVDIQTEFNRADIETFSID